MQPTQKTERRLLLLSITQAEDNALELLDKYTPAILRRIDNKGLSDKYDDIYQEIAIAVIDRSRKGGINNLSPYIFQIAKNKIALACEKRRKHLDKPTDTSESSLSKCREEIEDDSLMLESIRLYKRERLEKVFVTAEVHLPTIQQKILRMFYLEHQSHVQIASELKITAANVRQHKSRAVRKLKTLLT